MRIKFYFKYFLSLLQIILLKFTRIQITDNNYIVVNEIENILNKNSKIVLFNFINTDFVLFFNKIKNKTLNNIFCIYSEDYYDQLELWHTSIIKKSLLPYFEFRRKNDLKDNSNTIYFTHENSIQELFKFVDENSVIFVISLKKEINNFKLVAKLNFNNCEYYFHKY